MAPSAYSAFVTAIEPYKFDSLIYDGTDSTVRDAMERFIKRVNTETGTFCQLVESGASGPDSRFIINVGNGVVLSDGTTLTAAQTCWWAGGVASGATYAEDLTNAVYPNAVDVSPRLTHSQYVEAINKGQFVFNVDDGTVRVEYDLDSLTTFTTDIGEVYYCFVNLGWTPGRYDALPEREKALVRQFAIHAMEKKAKEKRR